METNYLGSNLRFLRKSQKMTQTEVAAELGIARTTYCNYELGKHEPDHDMMKHLSNYFKKNLDEMLTLDLNEISLNESKNYDAFVSSDSRRRELVSLNKREKELIAMFRLLPDDLKLVAETFIKNVKVS